MSEHEQFLEMCAGYALGSLADRQIEELDDHLETCPQCRQSLREFQGIVSMGLPALAPDFALISESNAAQSIIDGAQQRVLARIQNKPIIGPQPNQPQPTTENAGNPVVVPSARKWSSSWRVFAAALAIMLTVGTVEYHYVASAYSHPAPPPVSDRVTKDTRQSENSRLLTTKIEELQKDRDHLSAQLEESNRLTEKLAKEVGERLAESAVLKKQLESSTETLGKLQAQIGTGEADRQALAQRLTEVRSALDVLQQRLNSVLRERVSYIASNATLERRLDDLSRELKEKSKSLDEQADLLSHDRDIRDIIGARDLYVAEVNDVGRDAKTQEPFGRVFFTKGKSLIFYAYDLDRQDGQRKASTFQAWGRRGHNFSQALPLGIMYLDSSSKRRWVLRLDDPSTLAKIDAVFVTVEPSGGSEKPTGKPLLFAYLKIEPNHP